MTPAKRSGMRRVVLSFVVLAGLVIAVPRGAADPPPGWYTISNDGMPDGTVLDNQTGLTWQQAVPAMTYTWAEAGAYCSMNPAGLPGTGWRLPSMQELETIVDDCQPLPPAIDPNAFPGTPAEEFWTSSPFEPMPGFAWVVYFKSGIAYGDPVGNGYGVRCVR
jgi:Protein of unknown function (DUF1566)